MLGRVNRHRRTAGHMKHKTLEERVYAPCPMCGQGWGTKIIG